MTVIFNSRYNLLIILSFLVFVVLSHLPLPGAAYGETGYIESCQVILIVSVLIVGFIRKGYLINVYSRVTYWLRQSLFGLLFFEEISYLTTSESNFLDYNVQSELNFHNSRLLVESFASFDLLGDDSILLTPYLFISIFVVIFLYAGASMPFLKRFSIISLHPLVRIGILFYPFNIAFGYLVRNLLILDYYQFANIELVELFLCIILLIDILVKSYPRLSANSGK